MKRESSKKWRVQHMNKTTTVMNHRNVSKFIYLEEGDTLTLYKGDEPQLNVKVTRKMHHHALAAGGRLKFDNRASMDGRVKLFNRTLPHKNFISKVWAAMQGAKDTHHWRLSTTEDLDTFQAQREYADKVRETTQRELKERSARVSKLMNAAKAV